MKKKIILLTFSLSIVLLLNSCKSEKQKKMEVANKITLNICDELENLINKQSSELSLSNDIQLSIIKILLESGGKPSIKLCNCFATKLKLNLVESFSLSELKEMQNDNLKKVIVFDKMFQNKKTQNDLVICVKKVANEYKEFGDKLNQK